MSGSSFKTVAFDSSPGRVFIPRAHILAAQETGTGEYRLLLPGGIWIDIVWTTGLTDLLAKCFGLPIGGQDSYEFDKY